MISNYPNAWQLKDLINIAKSNQTFSNSGKWIPARPMGYPSPLSRIRIAWLVFTGKADAVIWPEGQ